jgi:uncharacterized membrane protein YqjE
VAQRPADQPSLGQLVASVSTDVQALVKGQIELTKLELSESAQQGGKAIAPMVVAGVLAFLGFVFLLVAAAYGLVAAGLPVWASFLIVAVVLLIVGAILFVVGRKNMEKIRGPERTIKAVEATKAALTGGSKAA